MLNFQAFLKMIYCVNMFSKPVVVIPFVPELRKTEISTETPLKNLLSLAKRF